jgi:hypothetical protein
MNFLELAAVFALGATAIFGWVKVFVGGVEEDFGFWCTFFWRFWGLLSTEDAKAARFGAMVVLV